MRIVWIILFALAAWKWSNWRNWREYYPTLLFMMLVSVTTTVITYNHRLWIFLPRYFLSTHILSDFWIVFLFYPSTVFMYLSNYPKGKIHQVFYIFMRAMILGGVEATEMFLNLITYAYGWSLGWSISFDVVMFTILRMHYLNPLLAWGLSASYFAFIWVHFGFFIGMLK